MKLRDIIVPGAIVPRLTATTRDEVIGELVSSMIASSVVGSALRQEIITAVLNREKNGSTGFGKGVAIPHVRHAGIGKLAAAIGISPSGIDFNALDKQPVYSVFLLFSPADRPEDHLQAMEVIMENLRLPEFRNFLRQSQSIEDVQTLIEDADAKALGGR